MSSPIFSQWMIHLPVAIAQQRRCIIAVQLVAFSLNNIKLRTVIVQLAKD